MTFDEAINRRISESYKWREYPDDVLPLFVADMDFRSPEAVVRALRAYVQEAVFGYPRGLHTHDRAQLEELTSVVVGRMADRYDWPQYGVSLFSREPKCAPAFRARSTSRLSSDSGSTVKRGPPAY